MTFSRANPLSWALMEVFTSAQANHIDINQSRAIDGFAGGAYNPTAAIVINNQFEVNSTGAAGANVAAIIATGKGSGQGVYSVGGATDGTGVTGIGGAPGGEGVAGGGIGVGSGVRGAGGVTNGTGVEGTGGGTGPGIEGTGGVGGGRGGVFTGIDAREGVKGTGGGTAGTGTHGTGGAADGIGVWGVGGVANGKGGRFDGTGTGDGLLVTGGNSGGNGIVSIGKLTGDGIQAQGGATNGRGVLATGIGTGTGVDGYGGVASGTGVHGTGGAPDGTGVKGDGDGAAAGVHGIGGDNDGAGGVFTGGTTDGRGAFVTGTGTGDAIALRRTTGAHINMQPVTGDPAAPAAGDVWVGDDGVAGDDEIIAYVNGNKHQLLDTWADISVVPGLPGVPTINANNNIASVDASNAGFIELTFDRPFDASTDYAAVGISNGTRFVTIGTQAAATVSFVIMDSVTGLAIAHNNSTYELRVIIKAYFA